MIWGPKDTDEPKDVNDDDQLDTFDSTDLEKGIGSDD